MSPRRSASPWARSGSFATSVEPKAGSDGRSRVQSIPGTAAPTMGVSLHILRSSAANAFSSSVYTGAGTSWNASIKPAERLVYQRVVAAGEQLHFHTGSRHESRALGNLIHAGGNIIPGPVPGADENRKLGKIRNNVRLFPGAVITIVHRT